MKTEDVKEGGVYETEVAREKGTAWVPFTVYSHLWGNWFAGELGNGQKLQVSADRLRPLSPLSVRAATPFDGISCNFCDEPELPVRVISSRSDACNVSVRMCCSCVRALRGQTG